MHQHFTIFLVTSPVTLPLILLFDKDGIIIDQYQYLKDPGVDIPLGRSPDREVEFQKLSAMTKGMPNTQPMPTSTPTVAATLTPTKTPSPTKAPTPTKTPKITKTPTPVKIDIEKFTGDSEIRIDPGYFAEEKDDFITSPPEIVSPSRDIDKSSSSATITPKPGEVARDKEVLVKEMRTKKKVLPPFIFIGIAVVFIACAILMFVRMKKSN